MPICGKVLRPWDSDERCRISFPLARWTSFTGLFVLLSLTPSVSNSYV
jgi:hypothetical protein